MRLDPRVVFALHALVGLLALACGLTAPRPGAPAPAAGDSKPTAASSSSNASASSVDPHSPAVPATTGGPRLGNCPIFPADNYWNVPILDLPVHARSREWIDSIGRDAGFHMDFGSGTWDGGPIGIPFNVIAATEAGAYQLDFYYPEESDSGPYPLTDSVAIEWGGDHHILTVETQECKLYEIFDASREGSDWGGGSGAIWSLRTNDLRPADWTSADAAGLPILPGLARYDEVINGEIRHALRFTANSTSGYIWPARHLTSGDADTLTSTPPMGARFRLMAAYHVSTFPPELQVILRAMQIYGIVLADNGSDWYVSGAPDDRWDNDMLHLLDVLEGSDFEAVDTSALMLNPDSAAARQ